MKLHTPNKIGEGLIFVKGNSQLTDIPEGCGDLMSLEKP